MAGSSPVMTVLGCFNYRIHNHTYRVDDQAQRQRWALPEFANPHVLNDHDGPLDDTRAGARSFDALDLVTHQPGDGAGFPEPRLSGDWRLTFRDKEI